MKTLQSETGREGMVRRRRLHGPQGDAVDPVPFNPSLPHFLFKILRMSKTYGTNLEKRHWKALIFRVVNGNMSSFLGDKKEINPGPLSWNLNSASDYMDCSRYHRLLTSFQNDHLVKNTYENNFWWPWSQD